MEDDTKQPESKELLAAFLRRLLSDKQSSYEAIYTAVGGTPENRERFFKFIFSAGYIVANKAGTYLLTNRGKRVVKKA